MKSLRLFLVLGLLMGVSGIAVAQQPATPAARGGPQNFRGAAKQFNTTPEAMEAAYNAALVANPSLTRGRFLAANMLSKNLIRKFPGVTVDAILLGLKEGKNMRQALFTLGVPPDEAQAAEAEAEEAIKPMVIGW